MGRKKCVLCGESRQLSEISYHRFPNNIEMRHLWIRAVNIDENMINSHSVICSGHFNSRDIITAGKRRSLLPNAVPVSSLESKSEGSSEETDSVSPSQQDAETLSNSSYIQVEEHAEAISIQLTSSEPVAETLSSFYIQDREHAEDIQLTSSEPIAYDEGSSITDTRKRRYSTTTVEEATNPTHHVLREKQKIFRYIGDFTREDIEDPDIRSKFWFICRKTFRSQRMKIASLQKSKRRMSLRIQSVQNLTQHLRDQNLISESVENTLNNSMSSSAQAVFKRLLKGSKKGIFPPELRKFALTLNFYSKKAYNYVRNTFGNVLPHVKTISKWYSTVNAGPGFMQEAMNSLKQIAQKAEEDGKKVICNLVFDEMAIRQKVEWDGTKTYGYVDFGTVMDSDRVEEAKNALVFMLVCLNSYWKIPVAYFLINQLTASEKANIISNCLEIVYETGVEVVSMTFDGTATNFAACQKLGADLKNLNDLKPYFAHPVTSKKVHIFLDICHMLKLVRNCLGTFKQLKFHDGIIIDWCFLQKLSDVQEIEGLHAATKLRRRHLQWYKEKMKVSLAVQTFSKSVGDALDFLNLDLQNPNFAESQETANFCRWFNNSFDIFNSRNVLTKKTYEKPLSSITAASYFEYLNAFREYIEMLKIGDEPILLSQRKTGFLGWIISIESLKLLYEERVVKLQDMKYLLTYKLSQDHIEILFSCIRSKGGFNNNPTARQFQATMKRLLVHTEIRGSERGNASILENTPILHCSSASPSSNWESVKRDSEVEILEDWDIGDSSFFNANVWHLTLYSEDIIAYAAGFVVRKLKKKIKCPYCLDIMECDEALSRLQIRKTYGVLTNASSYVVIICKVAENCFKIQSKQTNFLKTEISRALNILVLQTLENVPRSLESHFSEHLYDDDPLSNHFLILTKLIIRAYLSLRFHHELSKLHQSKERIRSMLTKTILFRNQ